MHASGSHVASMMPLATRLVQDNHYVHVLESNGNSDHFNYPEGINYTYFQLPDDPFISQTVIDQMWTNVYGPTSFGDVWKSGDKALVEMYRLYPEEISSLAKQAWDLVVADELFAVASHGLSLVSKRRGDNFIILSTCVSSHIIRWHLALGSNFIHRPSMFQVVGQPFDPSYFASRLHATFHAIWIHIDLTYVTSYVAIQGFKLMGIHDFNLPQLTSQTSYYFVDDVNQLVWPYPVSNEIINIGNNCPEIKSLPEDFAKFLEDPQSKGTILITLGSHAHWEYADKTFINAFVEAINNLTEYRVIFTYNGKREAVQSIRSHCMVTKWSPQRDILTHRKTKLFVSHGGMKSVKETICGGVPVIYVPLFAEQTHNAELGRSAGFAEVLDKSKLNSEKLVLTMRKVSGNPSYRNAVGKLRSFFVDHPIRPIDRAAFYVRRAIKTKTRGRYPTFKRKGMYLNCFTYFFCDLTVIFVILTIVLSYK